MTVTLRDPVGIVLALRADDLADLELHQLMHDAEPDTDAEREQSLPRCPDEPTERLLNWRWERTLRCLQGRDDLRRGYLPHGGPSCPRGLGWRLSRSQRERTRREDRRSKFYEISDNLESAAMGPRCKSPKRLVLSRVKTSDRGLVAEGGVSSLTVVVPDPAVKGGGALVAVAVDPTVGPS